MSKGFSTLEISALIICAGIATHGMAKDKHITLNYVVSEAGDVANTGTKYVDATIYLRQVNQGLEKINGS